jgi:hypothetical protein
MAEIERAPGCTRQACHRRRRRLQEVASDRNVERDLLLLLPVEMFISSPPHALSIPYLAISSSLSGHAVYSMAVYGIPYDQTAALTPVELAQAMHAHHDPSTWPWLMHQLKLAIPHARC